MYNMKKGRKLNRTSSHRKAMLSNMVVSLIKHESIKTTVAKAKEIRRMIDKLIYLGIKNSVFSRRLVFKVVKDRTIVKKIFDVIAPRYNDRNGGCTTILKVGFRKGDNAPLSIIKLINNNSNDKIVKDISAK